MPNEHLRIPNLSKRSYAEIVEMFLPKAASGSRLQGRVANFLDISCTGSIMENLEWLGLFSDKPANIPGESAADALVHLLKTKLALPSDGRDLVIIAHDIEACYPAEGDRRERILSTFRHYGEPGGMTAMAMTVGLPAAIAAKLVMRGEIPLTGSLIPTHERIYGLVLQELAAAGMRFEERVASLDAAVGAD
jgi:saccharopine dehydrogenase (NADP+, L-glutamate forming)